MKQFLVLIAVLPIMLVIMVQYSLNTIVNVKVDAVSDIVYTYKEIARQDGTFHNVITEMKNKIAEVCNINADDIITEGTYVEPKPIYKINSLGSSNVANIDDLFIHYKIKVPISELKSLGFLLKLNKDNYYYVIDSFVASEKSPSK